MALLRELFLMYLDESCKSHCNTERNKSLDHFYKVALIHYLISMHAVVEGQET